MLFVFVLFLLFYGRLAFFKPVFVCSLDLCLYIFLNRSVHLSVYLVFYLLIDLFNSCPSYVFICLFLQHIPLCACDQNLENRRF